MPRRARTDASPRHRPGRARPPGERDEKVCARCGRPFTWRKKWARDWENVRYCSDRCRMGRGAADGA